MRLRWVFAVLVLLGVSLAPPLPALAASTVSATVQIRKPDMPVPGPSNTVHGTAYLFTLLEPAQAGV